MKRFSQRVQRVLQYANESATKLNHEYIGSEHILLGLLKLGNGYAIEILGRLGVKINEIRAELLEIIKPGKPMLILGQKEYTPLSKEVLDASVAAADNYGVDFVGTEHLLMGLSIISKGLAYEILERYEVTLNTIESEYDRILNEENIEDGSDNLDFMKDIDNEIPSDIDKDMDDDDLPEDNPDFFNNGSPFPGAKHKTGKTAATALDKFGSDLTQMAREGKLDPVIGREEEVKRVIQILSRRTKNNPVLIGDPGVGKTAIVEGLAQGIVANEIPEILLNKRIIKLELGNIVAGTKYRGQFEERIKAIIREIKTSKDIILFIDEIHTIVGAGSAEGALDASNMFKPALSRGELQCIGATTLDEFRRIEKDGALARRFQPIIVSEPSIDETIEILKGLRPKYEAHHKVIIDDTALKAAAELSARYITERFLPDKAIDLVDEAGSEQHLNGNVLPDNLKKLKGEIHEVTAQKDKMIDSQHFEKAAKLRDRERTLKKDYEAKLEAWKGEMRNNKMTVSYYDIARIVSKATGIPIHKLEKDESVRLLDMEKYLKTRIIGQEEAVTAVSKAIRRGRAGLKDPNRPVGSFIFLGPTGVGKTELAKVLSEYLFGSENALIRIDMSEYMEKFSVSRLTGAPPGYVGYDEGGELTEKVRRKPYSIILFDEVEKAHPDIFDILLQVLEDGRLTDSTGRVIDFRNAVIILTSNAGTKSIGENKKIGIKSAASNTGKIDYATIKKDVLDAAKQIFKPEFINRLDDIIVFKPLTEKHIKKILDIMISDVNARLRGQSLEVTLSPEVKDFLVGRGFNEAMGARELRRTVQRFIEDPVSEMILRSQVAGKRIIRVSIKNGLPIFRAAKQ